MDGQLRGREDWCSMMPLCLYIILACSDNQNSAHFPEHKDPRYDVQTEEGRLQIANKNITAYPGEAVPFGVKVADDLNLSTVAVFRFSGMTDLSDSGSGLEFFPSVVSLSQVSEASINISFLKDATRDMNDPIEVIVESLLQKNVDRVSFLINLKSCPPGYVLLFSVTHSHLHHCQCDLENEGIVSCDGLSIQIKDGYWASASSMQTFPCPRLYCRCHVFSEERHCSNVLNGSNPDDQCACDRQGVLCGSCRGDKGVSALLNRCVSCSNVSGLLILSLIVADSLVYIGLIFLSRQFPAWLFPCLLYLQILPFIAESFPLTFGKAFNPLYYITSTSSFYFVYDFCLLHNLSPLLSYFLRYIPLFIALVLCPVILFIIRSCRHYRGRGRKLRWHGIWWILNLMYSHLVHTSFSILNCFDVRLNSDTSSQRWYINGDVECFKGSHLALSILALLVLLAAFFAIPLTAIIASKKLKWYQKLLSEPLSGSFKDQYRWWPAVELGRRFVLILFIVVFPANNFPAMIIISMFIVITGMTWPYKDVFSTLLDLILSIDVLLLLLLKNTRQFIDDHSGVTLDKDTSSSIQCLDNSFQSSTLSIILLPFYYLPLLLSIIALCAWVAAWMRMFFSKKEDLTHWDFDASDREYKFERAPTVSEVNLQEFGNDGDFEIVGHYTRITEK